MPEIILSGRFILPCAILLALAGCGGEPGAPRASFSVSALDVPAATGSLAPHLARAAGGDVVLSWTEAAGDRHRLLYSTLGESGWSEPKAVGEGTDWFVNWADFPTVIPLPGSLWAAQWLVRQPGGGHAFDVRVSLSRDGGARWSAPVTPHDDATPTEHGFVSVYPQGAGAGLVWLDGRKMMEPSQETSLRAATLLPDSTLTQESEVDGRVCDCCQTDVALTEDGAVAAYRDRSTEEIRDISLARLKDGRWQAGQRVAADDWKTDACPVNGPAVDADGARVAVAWFTAAGGAPRVRVAQSRDAGLTFGEPVDVASGATSGHAGVALLAGDAVAVSWTCELPGRQTGVCIRSVSRNGALGDVHLVSGRDVVPLSVPQLVAGQGRLVAAWTSRAGDSTVVSSAAVTLGPGD